MDGEHSSGGKVPETLPKQFYRSKQSIFPALELLEREDLREDDIISFCQGKKTRPLSLDSLQRQCMDQEELYRRRRKELQSLLRKVKTGDARVDEDGRLVEVANPSAPPAIQLPPPPQIPRNPPPLNGPQWLDHEEEDREWIAQGEREAAAGVDRVLEQWRNEGVAEEDLVFVRVPPNDDQANLTFRRVCFAVLAVVGAFTAIMLQTLPLSSPAYPNPEKLLGELLHVKTIDRHIAACEHLDRTENLTEWDRLSEFMGARPLSDDCGDGVLHIPSRRVILDQLVSSQFPKLLIAPVVQDIMLRGLDKTWFFDCQGIPGDGNNRKQAVNKTGQSSTPVTSQCFRGIHDDFLPSSHIKKVIDAGARMILQGGDHYDIYRATEVPESLEPIFEKTKEYLQQVYSVLDTIHPVAFRIGAEGSMDGKDGPRVTFQSLGVSGRPVSLLNLTNYVQYVERVGKRNGFAQFSLPWPLRVQPYRDECNLLADMQVDRRFRIHTMVFLTDGGSSGSEFRGGETLYVDNHPSNSNPRRKIRRGLVIDSVRGRLVVSTGGMENRRCRLPIRSGVRAALQIWWQF